MAGFCSSCGAPLTGGKFCPSCGAAAATSPPAVPPATPSPTSPPAAPPTSTPPQGSSSVLKIVLIVLGIFVFLIMLAMGSCIYIGYRVKKRAEQFTQEIAPTPYKGTKNPCRLVTAVEVSQALGQEVNLAEVETDSRCLYHFGPNPGDALPVDFTWEGGAATLKLTHGAMKGISGMDTFKPLPGIGDEAYLAPMGSMLLFRKGDVMVSIDMRTAGQNGDAAEKIARIIAGRL